VECYTNVVISFKKFTPFLKKQAVIKREKILFPYAFLSVARRVCHNVYEQPRQILSFFNLPLGLTKKVLAEG